MFCLVALVGAIDTPCAYSSETDGAISGSGVIDRVVASGVEPVFRADGYAFRVVSATEVHFAKGITTLDEVDAGTWATFEGKIDASGTVVATKAVFIPLKASMQKPDPTMVQVTEFPPESKVDGDLGFAVGSAAFPANNEGGWCGWYPVPSDLALQERVRRIGMRVVPRYQRDLPQGDPRRIPFRFYAVDATHFRADMYCGKGLILVPVTVVQRLTSDDLLAAVLADGVAGELQQLEPGLRGMMNANAGYFPAGNALGLAGPAPVALFSGAMLVANHKIARSLEHSRARIALGLMADAGYDVERAPEAWRLLAPHHLPKDMARLKDTERSQYIKAFLDEQKASKTRSAGSH